MKARLPLPGLLAVLLAEAALVFGQFSSTRLFDVKRFGAAGDGITLDTAAIQQTLDACAQAGGGTVELPAGTYLSQPLFLKGNGLTVQLDAGATLQATDGFSDYSDPRKRGGVVALVNAIGLSDLTITGQGVIDGAGAKWWPDVKRAKQNGRPEPRPRPRLVLLLDCRHVHVTGITLRNSPSFHLVPRNCEDVTVEDLTIRAPADSPNTDATDPSACRRVVYRHCTFDVGDDNIAIKSAPANEARPGPAAEDILVADCTFLAGHGLSIGSETAGGIRNLMVRDCTFDGTTSGIRIKSDRSRGGLVESCTYSNLTMRNVKLPINLTCYYPKVPATDSGPAATDQTPRFRDVKIMNLTAESPQSAGVVLGLPESCISNVMFDHVRITARTGLTLRNTRAVTFKNSAITVAEGEPLILETNAEVFGRP
jgi:polygalacturonase